MKKTIFSILVIILINFGLFAKSDVVQESKNRNIYPKVEIESTEVNRILTFRSDGGGHSGVDIGDVSGNSGGLADMLRESDNNTGGGGGGGSQSSSSGGMSEAEKKAKKASDEAAKAIKSLTKLKDEIEKKKKQLEKLEKKLEKDEDKIDELREEIEEQEEEAKQAQIEANKKLDDMTKAYQQLAEEASKYVTTGDPVAVASGNFISEYIDFTAQDFLEKYSVDRRRTEEKSLESFGFNWTCPFDSRIIHTCKYYNDNERIVLLGLKNDYEKIRNTCLEYKNEYKEYKNSEIEKIYETANKKIKTLDVILSVMSEEKEKINKIKELNKYVTYGTYANSSNYERNGDMLIYVDDKGNSYFLVEDESGKWTCGTGISSKQFSVKIESDERFCVTYENGRKKYYSKYGVLESEEDRNGNITNYESTNGRITSVKLKTGEILNILRNPDGTISKISGEVSGNTTYEYENGRIKSVTDNNGINVGYKYDSEGYLSEIKKADGTKIQMTYEYDEYSGKKVCTQVTNENGDTESFLYDYKNETVIHTDVTGLTETYKIKNGFTVLFINGEGESESIEKNENGLISSVTKNGITKNYIYDQNFHPVQTIFSDGGSQSAEYTNFGQILSVKDRDGFETSYSYDSKGNITGTYFCGTLISSVNYFQNGLISNLTENGITYAYEYNPFGSIVKKTWTDEQGKSYSEEWKYDSKNRVVNYKNIAGNEEKTSYSDKEKIIKTDTKQKTVKYNLRGWLSEIKEEDLKTGKSFTIKYVYDGRGNVKKVFLNGEEYINYSYNKFGKITEITTYLAGTEKEEWVKQSFLYDDFGYLIGEKSITQKDEIEKYHITYKNEQNNRIVEVTSGNNIIETDFYNTLGQLEKILKSDGYEKRINYSKGGRILSEEDTNGKRYIYQYKTDGSKNVRCIKDNGIEEVFYYDQNNNLLKFQNSLNEIYDYGYDSFGRKIFETVEGGKKSYEYDMNGRLVKEITTDENGKICFAVNTVYDDEKRTKSVYEGNYLKEVCVYDAWNRILEKSGANGKEKYDYDWYGNVICKTDKNGNITNYEYSAGNNILKEKGNVEKLYKWNAGGNLLGIWENGNQIYSAEYDLSGKIEKEVNRFGNELLYNYGKNGIVNALYKYDTGNVDFNMEKGKVIFSDANGNQSIYETGRDGQIVKETDSMNNYIEYQRDNLGRILKKNSSSGRSVYYDYGHNGVDITYGNGKKNHIERNITGNLTKAETENDCTQFFYDEGGSLVWSYNNDLGIKVEYEYDEFGRCIRKSSDIFTYDYKYDSIGQLLKVENEESGAWVSFSYDKQGNLIEEKYSNGVKKTICYDENGRKKNETVKNRSGLTVYSENISYDSKGRICKVVNDDNEGKFYEYDKKGRLFAIYSPYTENQVVFARKEAEECGLGIKNDEPEGEMKNGQYSWFEKYEYTSTGNILAVTNPFGKIVFEYDKMNRITKKHGSNSAGLGGIFFRWNNDNCLEEIESGKRIINFKYGEMLRPTEIVEKDLEGGEVFETFYKYDSLGRRVSEISGGIEKRYIYDGTTNQILVSSIITNSGRVFAKEETSKLYDANIEMYKWFSVEEKKENKSENRPCSTLCCFGKPLIKSYLDGAFYNGYDNEFILSDYRGSSICTFDENGERKSFCEYDAWGNFLSEGKNNTYGAGNAQIETNLQIVDFGTRDYIPEIKIFTTCDPVKDGTNFFVYCACDPLNYTDVNGKFKDSMTETEKALYAASVAQTGKFDWQEAHDTGSSQGIRREFDCADVTFCVDTIASTAAGYEMTSEKAKAFKMFYDNGQYTAAKNTIQAKDYYTDSGANMRKTGDRNDMTNPDIITPGTVFSFKDDPSTAINENHALMVIAVEYDPTGTSVVGVAYIEGHTGGDKTEVGYMSVGIGVGYQNGIYNLDNWRGEFMGSYEIEKTPIPSKKERTLISNEKKGCGK